MERRNEDHINHCLIDDFITMTDQGWVTSIQLYTATFCSEAVTYAARTLLRNQLTGSVVFGHPGTYSTAVAPNVLPQNDSSSNAYN
jgi:hypothetical protein